MELVKNYANNNKLRQSMSTLSKDIFGLDFEPFYKSKYWTERYINVSVKKENTIISNVSCYELDIKCDDKIYKGVQLGAVMTDPHYRHQGLAKKIMLDVLDIYKDKDLLYLFANEEVIDFYKMFDFEPVKQMKCKQSHFSDFKGSKGKKLDFDKDRKLIESYVRNCVSLNDGFSVLGNDDLKMFHLLYAYSDCIYLHDDVILVIESSEDQVYLHDVYAQKPIDLNDYLKAYVDGKTCLYYGFKVKGQDIEEYDYDNGLYVLTKHEALKKPWIYPDTSVT